MGNRGEKRRERRLTLLCGFPEDVNDARVTLFGHHSVMVEGQHGMVELSTSCMRMRTQGSVLTVLGEELMLRELSADAAMIIGKRVDTVTYARMTEG